MLLIRPIISYAAPILWNFNHTTGEKVRALEHKCLRTCLRLYRTPESDWKHYVSNPILYDRADIPRIDSFMISLAREYFSKLPHINNVVINSLATQTETPTHR